MKRDIYTELLNWKKSERRKPLVLKGARQVGKTYILQEFGKNEYNRTAYFNFEKDPMIDSLFQQNLDPDTIITNLSIQIGFEIKPESDLIIFDEIQYSNSALNSLKYFCEDRNDYHIVAAGSLLGILLSKPKSFPVGKVNFMELYPMTFPEFLDAIDVTKLRYIIEQKQDLEPIVTMFHDALLSFFRLYLYIGGMPEAVNEYTKTKDLKEVREIHKEIINSYILDFAKHSTTSDIPKINMVWDSIPTQLAKENKKFKFSIVKKGARSRDYENAIQWLEKAGLIYKSFQTATAKYPLKSYAKNNIFKIFVLDVGLLGAMSNLSELAVIEYNHLFTERKGAYTENYIAQQLIALYGYDLFYWVSEGIAEIDFLIENDNKIIPLEVKSGINPKSKSLRVFQKKFKPKVAVRSTQLNLKFDDNILNIPLYGICNLSNYLKLAEQKKLD